MRHYWMLTPKGWMALAADDIDREYLAALCDRQKYHPNGPAYAKRFDALKAGMYKYGDIPPRFAVPVVVVERQMHS